MSRDRTIVGLALVADLAFWAVVALVALHFAGAI